MFGQDILLIFFSKLSKKKIANQHKPVDGVIAWVDGILKLEPHKETDFVNDVVNVDPLVHILAGHDVHGGHCTVGSPSFNNPVPDIIHHFIQLGSILSEI